MTASLTHLTAVDEADVYKNGHLAARLSRTPTGVAFGYLPDYVASGRPAVATTLPVDAPPPAPLPGGGLPPYFAGLLPEGRRFSALRRAVKTSKDDELSLMLAVGEDLVGDVLVVPRGAQSPFARDPGGDPALATTEVDQSATAPGAVPDFQALRARHGLVDRAGLAGIQDKMSMRTIALPATLSGGRPYLVKLDPPEYPQLVVNEATTLAIAGRLRTIAIADALLIHDVHGEPGLRIGRFDRVVRPGGAVGLLPVEDGAQVLGLPPAEKYRVTSEEVADALVGLCAARPVALRALFVQLVWAWLSGNGDLHAKNVSIRGDGSGEWRIAPAYDIPSTLPYGDVHGMALTLGGRRDGLSRRTFLRFARDLGLPEPVAQRAIEDALRVGGDLLAAAEAGRFPLPPGAAPRKFARQLRARRTSIQS